MSRLLAAAHTDVRLQLRNGFYYAVAFVLVVLGAVYSQLPTFDWGPWLPPLLLGNLVVATFFFMGGLVLLEKAEGSLEALVVTPLRLREYLGAKVLTLGVLSMLESLIVVLIVSGSAYCTSAMLLGITSAAVLYTLFGFVVVARYDSINEYILPSTLYVTILQLPILDYFELWPTDLMFLHPMQGSMVFMKAGVTEVTTLDLILAVVSTTCWLVVAWWLSCRAFRRFVVRKEGVR